MDKNGKNKYFDYSGIWYIANTSAYEDCFLAHSPTCPLSIFFL